MGKHKSTAMNHSGCGPELEPRRRVGFRVLAWVLISSVSLVLVTCAIVIVLVFHRMPLPTISMKYPATGFQLQAQLEGWTRMATGHPISFVWEKHRLTAFCTNS